MRLSRDDKHISEARELFEASADSDFYTLMRGVSVREKQWVQFGIVPPLWHPCANCEAGRADLRSTRAHRQTPKANRERGTSGRCFSPRRSAAPLHHGGLHRPTCIRRSQGTLDCELTEGRQGTLVRESVVQTAKLFVSASIREVPSRTSENLTLLSLASAVKREWIEEMFPQQVNSRVEHLYDTARTNEWPQLSSSASGDLVIHHEHQRDVEPSASGRCLAEAWRKGYFELPLFNHEVKQFVARVNCVAAVMPELDFPAFDEAALVAGAARAFSGLSLAKEAQATPLKDNFVAHLAPEQRGWLNEIAPQSIPWAEGRQLKLQYAENALDEDGEAVSPEAQVKIQECFQLKEHPHICEGKLPVKLWLCTPDGKRLEATFNWPAFRSVTYPKLKLQLQKKFSALLWP